MTASSAPTIDTAAAREFALDVVRRLRAAGFEALWAGGCVRDHLLGLTPKDYDVATNGRPEQIREVFGRRRTIEVGASFGVVAVLGPRGAGQVEVATFRCDGQYLDGRHPASVTFSTAELDAQRRDFTINGLFYDPITEQVIDYVGGQDDLQRQVIRAIRNPHERFDEDKLRMLRAVRFAATFGFAIEPETMAAIQQLAGEIVVVSAERVAAEMRRMLVHLRSSLAMRLLEESRLLPYVLPEAIAFDPEHPSNDPSEASLRWETMLATLSHLDRPTFGTALAALLRPLSHLPSDHSAIGHLQSTGEAKSPAPDDLAEAMCRRWRLANEEIDVVRHLLRHEPTIRAAQSIAWPQLQRVLVSPHVEELLTYCSAICRVVDGNTAAVEFCCQKLALPVEELNPPPLLTGNDLKKLGLRAGPQFKRLLDALRDAQLDKLVRTRDEAIAYVQQLHVAE